MSKPIKKTRRSNYIAQIEEIYRDHPCMEGVNALKAELKQEKMQDKAFYQAIKLNKVAYQ